MSHRDDVTYVAGMADAIATICIRESYNSEIWSTIGVNPKTDNFLHNPERMVKISLRVVLLSRYINVDARVSRLDV